MIRIADPRLYGVTVIHNPHMCFPFLIEFKSIVVLADMGIFSVRINNLFPDCADWGGVVRLTHIAFNPRG